MIDLLGLPELFVALLAIGRMLLVGLDVQWCSCQKDFYLDCAVVHGGGVTFRRGKCGVQDPQPCSIFRQGYLVA